MALIAALLPREAQRRALGVAADGHEIAWCGDWRDLLRTVKSRPAATAIADLHAEKGKDGVLRVHRFAERFPLTPILVWGEMDGRDLLRLGKAGATDVLPADDEANRGLVVEMLEDAVMDRIADRIDTRLEDRVGPEARALVRTGASRITTGIQVPDLAGEMELSVSTLERRCDQWGLTTPGRLLLWLRILYGMRWLMEPGRSVESVSGQLGYSSGAAFRRALKATIGGRSTPARTAAAFDAALDRFIEECPGAVSASAVEA